MVLQKHYLYLALAIFFGLCGQILLQYTNGFTEVLFTIGCLASYFLGFSFLAFAVKKLPLSISYAIWGGVGTAMSVVFGVILFNESLSIIKIVGTILIIIGIVLLQLRKKKTYSERKLVFFYLRCTFLQLDLKLYASTFNRMENLC